jgi:nicotinamide mononucleotide transporter pnuC
VLYLVLSRFTDSPVPWGDAFTTALSILAMWMLAQKYIEQWGVWMVINAVSAALYFWKGMTPTAVTYVVYTIVPIFGYMRWRRMMAD